jgi:hypothetical protein
MKDYEEQIKFYKEIILDNSEVIKNDRVIISQLFGILNKKYKLFI